MMLGGDVVLRKNVWYLAYAVFVAASFIILCHVLAIMLIAIVIGDASLLRILEDMRPMFYAHVAIFTVFIVRAIHLKWSERRRGLFKVRGMSEG